MGWGQRFAVAAMEVCARVTARDNEVTIRWVPVHNGIPGNEKANEFAKAAASQVAPCNNNEVPDELRQEASRLHMSRSATEARTCASAEWVSSRVGAEHRYSPPREVSATSTCAAQEKSWQEGTTSSFPATQRLGRSSRTRFTRSIQIGAGGANMSYPPKRDMFTAPYTRRAHG